MNLNGKSELTAPPGSPAARDPRDEVLALLDRLGGLVSELEHQGRTPEPQRPAPRPPTTPELYAANLIRSSLDMIISVDGQRRIFEFNPAAEQCFGYTRAEVIGRPVDILYADPVRGGDVAHTALVEGFSGEVRNRRKNGEVFDCFVSASPICDSQGRVIGLMGISRDITEQKAVQEQLRLAHQRLSELNCELESKVLDRTRALRLAYDDTLDALVLALDTREHATSGHSRRVALYCLYLALQCDLSRDAMQDLFRGGLLHDIGKIGIPDAVLLKPGRLTPDEREVIERHVEIGVGFLGCVGYLARACDIPRYHHERFDGRGYPHGVAGEQIPAAARLFAIIDVYDALRSERPYKAALSHTDACQVIQQERGAHFDPTYVDFFLDTPVRVWEHLAQAASRKIRFKNALSACLHLRRDLSRGIDPRH